MFFFFYESRLCYGKGSRKREQKYRNRCFFFQRKVLRLKKIANCEGGGECVTVLSVKFAGTSEKKVCFDNVVFFTWR